MGLGGADSFTANSSKSAVALLWATAARKSEKAVTGRLPFPEPRLPRGNQPRAPLALRASRVVCLRGAFDSARALCSAALTVMITQHH